MTTKIQKWGNSLALRIPKSFAKAVKVEEGNEVSLKLINDKLVIEKENGKKYRLSSLVSKISRKNVHKEVGFGGAMGKEVW